MAPSIMLARGARAGPLLASGLFLAACMGSGPSDPTPSTRMWLHFDAAADLQFAMVRGDLERAQDAAGRIERARQIPGLPEGTDDALVRLRSYATNIREASSYDVAALATSLMAASCGDCHARSGAGPRFAEAEPLRSTPGQNHMVEHVWAADRMWEGLMLPSQERWEAGARVLAAHSVPMGQLAPGTSEFGVMMKTLGLEAMDETDLSNQARRYADILTTCSGCHTAGGF